MKTMIIFGLALVSLAQPLLADNVAISVKPSLMILRDSDGIVISINHPIDYYTPMTGINTGGHVVYTMGGVEVQFSSGPGIGMNDNMAGGGVITASASGGMGSGALPTTAVVGGTTYKVEVSGNNVWLRDPVTGARIATERRMASVQGASGMQVNPNGFAME